MEKRSLMFFIKKIERPVFATRELVSLSGKSASAINQSLVHLEKQGLVQRVYRGVWSQGDQRNVSPYQMIPLLFDKHRAYVSFLSALHLHGIVEQIPQVITLASTAHSRSVSTSLGTFQIHKICPEFFQGFSWYKKTGKFLIAEPEKALVDCLYLSTRKKKQFGHFPELYLGKKFCFKSARTWVRKIKDDKIRLCVKRKLEHILL